MEPQQKEVESVISPLKKVTPLSKYLAMVLFITLPFVGGWIGYTYAPEKVVEDEVTVSEFIKEISDSKSPLQLNANQFMSIGGDYYVLKSHITNNEKLFYKTIYWTVTTSPDGEYVQREQISFVEIPEADVDTFEVNGDYSDYATDKSHVYFFWRTPFESSPEDGVRIIAGADPETFEAKIVRLFDVSQGNTYQGWISRDKNNVFYRDEVIEGADPSTYIIGENVSINFDDDDVFLWHKKIPLADPRTYEIILDTSTAGRGTVFGRDAERCYKDYEVIACVEVPTTF